MGRWTNAKRKELFAELKASGQLDVPLYIRKIQPKKPKPKKKPVPKQLTPEQRGCCLYKYEGNLPEHFRRCPGCTVK